jgi:hypothetical protein
MGFKGIKKARTAFAYIAVYAEKACKRPLKLV